MQINRLFEIVYLLLDRKIMTAGELAAYFEVSKRTIFRDIETLTAARIPIYTKQGKGGGISIMEGFVLNKMALTEDEQNQILFALQSLQAAKYVDSGRILAKLNSLFKKESTDWIEVDFSRWGQGANDNVRFTLIRQSIIGKTALQFEYVGSNGEIGGRKVYPLKLVFKSRAWYLQGFCTDRQDYRTFKINRMLSVRKTEEEFSAEEYSPPAIEDMHIPAAKLVTLELSFASQEAYRVYDEFDESSVYRAEDGSIHVASTLPEDNWLYSFLLSFGKNVAVIRPQHVKENLLRMRSGT